MDVSLSKAEVDGPFQVSAFLLTARTPTDLLLWVSRAAISRSGLRPQTVKNYVTTIYQKLGWPTVELGGNASPPDDARQAAT
jgi:hypothetical protein